MAVKACGAKNRAGGRCTQPGSGAGGRCRFHGGATPVGPASPQWKHGERSRYPILPQGLTEHYLRTRAQTDAELLSLTEEIAVLDARTAQLFTAAAGPKTSKTAIATLWRQIEALFEQRRKMVESEQRRRKEAQETLSIRQGMALVSAVGHIVKREVTDRATVARIIAELSKLLRGPSSGGGDGDA